MKRESFMHQLLLASIAALACFGSNVAIHAQAPADPTVYAVAYVDVMPSGRSAAATALKAYRDASSKEGGHVRIDLFDQVGRPGHFIVVEAWRDQSAFDAHAGSAAT